MPAKITEPKMEIKSIEALSEELLIEFGDRKTKGRLDLVYSIDSGKFYPVPKDVEHKDFMPHLEGNPELLIPVQLRMHKENNEQIIDALLVGASGFEATYKVTHSPADIKEAYNQALVWLNSQAGFKISPKVEIMHAYAKCR